MIYTSEWRHRFEHFVDSIDIKISLPFIELGINKNILLKSDSFSKISAKIRKNEERSIDVFVITAHNVDEITSIDKIESDHECEALTEPTNYAGGSGANTAYILARFGENVEVTGIVGEDASGRFLAKHLADAGINVNGLLVTNKYATGHTTTMVERSGKRFIVVYPGANNAYADEVSFDCILEKAKSSRIVHLSSFVGEKERLLQEKLVQTLPEHSLISLTPGAIYAREGLDRIKALISHVDVIFLYKEQLGDIVRNSSANSYISKDDSHGLMEAYFKWKEVRGIKRAQVLVVKDNLGRSEGIIDQKFLSVGTGTTTLDKYISPKPLRKGTSAPAVDTTGSGDAAAAGFLHALLRREPLERCIDFSFAVAGFVSGKTGARTAFEDPHSTMILPATGAVPLLGDPEH
ncbi:MAG: carbohydrate kinase family protein [Telmatospirillum sp.]|nr:carbohydrate kinase family protein [Telmatospirillum sp.]